MLLTAFSCGSSEDADTPNEGNADIVGSVNLFNEKRVPRPNGGMTVSIEGTNLSTITSSEGFFTLSEVPFGTYRLQYEKEGYGTFLGEEFTHQANEDGFTPSPDSPFLGQISTTEIVNSRATLVGNDFIIEFETFPEGKMSNPVFASIFFLRNGNVSNMFNSAVIGPIIIVENPTVILVSQEELTEFGFSADEKVHMRVYGDSFFPNSYRDFGALVHPNVGPNPGPVMMLTMQ